MCSKVKRKVNYRHEFQGQENKKSAFKEKKVNVNYLHVFQGYEALEYFRDNILGPKGKVEGYQDEVYWGENESKNQWGYKSDELNKHGTHYRSHNGVKKSKESGKSNRKGTNAKPSFSSTSY